MIPAADMAKKADEVSALLKLLANPNRLMIACRLLEGEASVGDIEIELGIKQPTLSRELGKLRDEGIIHARRQSKIVFYTLAHPQMERLIRAICGASSDTAEHSTQTAVRQTPTPKFLSRPKFTHAFRPNTKTSAPVKATAHNTSEDA